MPEITKPMLSPEHFFNRELSWIKFNERVLEEAEDPTHPLLERLKFLSIFASNLDEFFMIRVAGLKDQVDANINERSADGRSAEEQLMQIAEDVNTLIPRHATTLTDTLLALEPWGVSLCQYQQLGADQKLFLQKYFEETIFPVLTPLAIDSAHPIPQLRGLGLNLLVELNPPLPDGEPRLAVVPVPGLLPRFIHFEKLNRFEFILIEEVIQHHLELLFPAMEIHNVSVFRITRNAGLDIAEAEADDLLKLIERSLRKRRLGTIVRLEVNQQMPEACCQFLMDSFDLLPEDLYRVEGFLAVDMFMQLYGKVQLPALKDAPFTPILHPHIAASEDIFEAIRRRDVLLLHPYDSFYPVVKFISDAAKDPNVLAIKMTLYRASGRSQIVEALKQAAENGKEVTALIELKARFDEEANIVWARSLEQAGVNVIYGLLGLKTHCKVTLVIRQEGGRIQPYVHLSTGNYNEKTALIYTDMGLLTCHEAIGRDISELFNFLTGYSQQQNWRQIFVAPINLREHLVALVEKCITHHSPENPSRIRIVLNSLVDPGMIAWLYRASQAGISVQLVIRGVCCLVPGLEGLSEHIEVRSIVGRFLEHTRILCFEYNGQQEVFSGSADWMQRNLNRRVEVIYPIAHDPAKAQVLDLLAILWADTCKARRLRTDGTYERLKTHLSTEEEETCISAQEFLIEQARSRQSSVDTIQKH